MPLVIGRCWVGTWEVLYELFRLSSPHFLFLYLELGRLTLCLEVLKERRIEKSRGKESSGEGSRGE